MNDAVGSARTGAGRAPRRAAPPRGGPASRFGVLLPLPALALFTGLILWPFLSSLWLAFHRYTMSDDEPVFNGLENLQRLIADPYFWQSWRITIFYVVVTSAATTGLGTIYALLLNQPIAG